MRRTVGPSLRIETDSGVHHAQPHAVVFFPFGFDKQLSWTIIDGVHRVQSIPDEIEDDLLQLNAVCRRDGRSSASSVRKSTPPFWS